MSHSPNFDYKIIYSKRRTLSVRISDDNSVVVRCPSGTPRSTINAFLNEKSVWIAGCFAKNAAVAQKFSGVFGQNQVLFGGRLLRLEICAENKIGDDFVRVKNLSFLRKLLVDSSGGDFLSRLESFAGKHNLSFNHVSFRSYKGRWGSCDAKNNMTFNYKLLMLPVCLQDYVIAHELCHTVCHDHSRAFHALLGSVFPSAAIAEKELKNYSFVARLYC